MDSFLAKDERATRTRLALWDQGDIQAGVVFRVGAAQIQQRRQCDFEITAQEGR